MLDKYIQSHKEGDSVLLPEAHNFLVPLVVAFTKPANRSKYVDLIRSIRDTRPSDDMQRQYRRIMTRVVQGERRPRITAIVRLIINQRALTTNTESFYALEQRVSKTIAALRARTVKEHRTKTAKGRVAIEEVGEIGERLDKWLDENIAMGVVALDPDPQTSKRLVDDIVRGIA